MDDKDLTAKSLVSITRIVQIPLWTIRTRKMEYIRDCNKYVQIPLWTIRTQDVRMIDRQIRSRSDSSMDDKDIR